MSAKAVIQGLEDSELIRLFLDFIATHRLHYQKTRKEISYKCYEATWVLPIAKATGYGRTQTEAYKNALKNLLELLMEDPSYVDYFSNAVLGQTKKNQKSSSPHPKPQLKTEGQEPDEKMRGQYESFTKIGVSHNKQQVHHSKINLNRSMSQKPDQQIEDAKEKIRQLEAKLGNVLEENKSLRERVLNIQDRSFQTRKSDVQKQLKKGNLLGKSQKSLLESSCMSKISIPKLNLEVLPNYHKKSEKCLNEALLAAYQQKHGANKVC